jgi:hypothetical protein
MNDERIWKEAVLACLRYYPDISWRDWGKPRKTARIGDVPTEVRIEHLPNTGQKRYRCANSLSYEEFRFIRGNE